MKRIQYYLLLLITITFSCEKNEVEFELPPPTLLTTTELPELVVQEAGNAIFQQYSLQSANGLDKFEVLLDGQSFDVIDYEEEISATYFFEYTIPEDTPNGTRSVFTFLLTDKVGNQVKDDINFLVNVTFFETNEEVNGNPVVKLKGRLNKDYEMLADTAYLIDSIFSVENNSRLTINAGTTVYFKTFEDPNLYSNLVIAQGSQIIAEGTAESPIVFTSDKLLKGETPLPYDWGGVVLYGSAPSNQGEDILDNGFRYGGNEPNDDSGILRYIRSEYAGNLLENGIHAFQLNGVGSGTQIDHVQVYRNYNIAFRFRGGRASVKHIAGIGHGGYGFWADSGWQGNGQFLLFQTDVRATLVPVNYWNLARSIELRNDDDNFELTPRTTGIFSNVTLIGNGFSEGVDNGTRRGVRYRRGAIGQFQNAFLTGFPNDGARVEDLPIETLGIDMIFDNVRSFGNSKNYEQEAQTIFFESGDYNVTEEPVPGISLTDYVGSVPSSFNPATLGNFFTSAPYIGAVENEANDWTAEGEWFKNLDGSIR